MPKPPINKPKPNSIRQRLMRLQIPQRTYYSVREELRDTGEPSEFESVVRICQERSRRNMN
jgi:hypothetical protein